MAPELFTDNGGIPRILRLYLKALCEIAGDKDRVRFIALNDHSADSRDLRRYSSSSLDAWQTCDQSKSRFIKSTLRLSQQSQRILCGHIAQLPVAFAARCLNPKLKYDVIAHGIEVWRPFTIAERIALLFSRKVLCISQYTRDHMLDYCGISPARMPIVPNGLDAFFPIAETVDSPTSPPTIVTVARLSKYDIYKGIDTLIEAMPLIRQKIPNACLCIMGKGDDAMRLRGIAAKLNLGNSVEMPGFVSDEKLQQRLKGCSLFALPSKKEGFGLVFLEAMAQGRPCLGARAGGIPEVITPEVGCLVDYGSVPMIAEACVDALQKKWDYKLILERAHHFSYHRFKERLAREMQSSTSANTSKT
jgi:phosphatidyl-myo-inositol dimannoside synthase